MLHRSIYLGLAAVSSLTSIVAHAGEDFQVRYNIAGAIGGEMFAPPDSSGLAVGVAATYIDIKKVTGNDGNTLTAPIPGGTVPLPAPNPAALYPSYGASTAQVDATGTFKIFNLAVGYITSDTYGGGRLVFGGLLPYGTQTKTTQVNASTPALHWNPAVPSAAQSAVAAQFGASYQGSLASQAAAGSGDVSGIGDLELQAGWLYAAEQLRVLAGVSLVLPTGQYNASNPSAPDIGFGNFYTVRPAIQVAYLPTPRTALTVKLSLGFNTTNRDDNVRSGNWLGLEGAAAYKASIGVFGLHTVFVQQYQSDSNNPWGSSRYQTLNAGGFFTTKVPVLNAALTLQYMATVSSRNARAGSFSQIRLIKVF
ncbi:MULTISPECIES: transporter [unclassified Paraburkholderia]|uniref:transporter n=1 Tax=unclassified Paraburkholderia TaxID=2615204 RepID=UPI001619EA11|nr:MULTISPECIES: transporter [unclassified Paraburkholderia]MBB5411355.1 hypothetical protein [Paraburkholderia sp. HC6.4b]MBB5449890.1 hypothetical protein [Paraburkholderia sp. Kb1A]